MSTLAKLIGDYRAIQAAYRAIDEADPRNAELWQAYEAADYAIQKHPCTSLEEVREKASFLLDDDMAFDSVESCRGPGGEPMLAIMLRSLLGQEPVEKSNSGGKAA